MFFVCLFRVWLCQVSAKLRIFREMMKWVCSEALSFARPVDTVQQKCPFAAQKTASTADFGATLSDFYYLCDAVQSCAALRPLLLLHDDCLPMKFSFLIPTYNYDCTALVHELCRQAEETGADYEVLVADDASTEAEVVQALNEIGKKPHCRVLRGAENVGRAAIRNRLAQEARGACLIFMDSDAGVCTPDFVKRYLAAAAPDCVVCGGILHPDHCPSADCSLRWRYEKAAERCFTVEKRCSRPYDAFRTFNFMIPRSVMLSAPFDENFRRYGYEDVLLGRRLQEMGVPVVHIDNPLLNLDIETNEHFLRKTEEANGTLCDFYEQLRTHSGIIRCYERLSRYGLTGVVTWLLGMLRPLLRRQLLSRAPSLFLFDVYKLGDFCRQMRKAKGNV